jgi:hypothetical protein
MGGKTAIALGLAAGLVVGGLIVGGVIALVPAVPSTPPPASATPAPVASPAPSATEAPTASPASPAATTVPADRAGQLVNTRRAEDEAAVTAFFEDLGVDMPVSLDKDGKASAV